MTGVIVLLAALGASVFDEPFQQANDAYAEGDYGRSAMLLERLVAEGVAQAPVFYNLGNTYYRMGDVGRAIANYERALYVEPGHYQAAHNLETTVAQTARKLPRPLGPAWEQSLLFWHGSLNPQTPVWLAMGTWVLFWVLLAARVWRPIRYLRTSAALLLVLTALFALSAWTKANPLDMAVAVDQSVPVRFRTDETATVRFELAAGDRVRLEAEDGEWARVAAASGERGWCPAASLERVGPPYPNPASQR